jgi:hypothetical protein
MAMIAANTHLSAHTGCFFGLSATGKRFIWPSILLLLFATLIPHLTGASPLSGCQEHFISANIQNAPTLFQSAPDEPFDSNVHLCYRTEDASFFALDYWPERFAPRWTAYQLSGDVFRPGGCNTYTRAMGNCYVRSEAWEERFTCVVPQTVQARFIGTTCSKARL